jgi:hypothetical protein
MDTDAQSREAKVGGGIGVIEKLVVDGKFKEKKKSDDEPWRTEYLPAAHAAPSVYSACSAVSSL